MKTVTTLLLLFSITILFGQQTDSLGIDNNSLLNRQEVNYFNSLLLGTPPDFDDKRVVFILDTRRATIINKQEFFNTYLKPPFTIIELGPDEKERSGGYDIIVLSPQGALSDKEKSKIFKELNGQTKDKNYSKEDAVKKVQELLKNAPLKMKANKKLEVLTKKSTNNFSTLVYITELTTQIGYHTKTYIAIAEIASKATHEIDYLDEIVELNGIKLSGTGGLIDLAKQAEKAKTGDELKKVKEEITKLKSTAKYKTIDEAIKDQSSK